MRTHLKLKGLPQLAAVALCVTAIKSHHSTASVDDLVWVLAPTTRLVEIVTGLDFTFESGAGYMSADHSFQIAASCSGVNFLIAAFLMIAVGWIWKRPFGPGWTFLPISLIMAYATTIVANTVRISTALQLRQIDPDLIWLNPDQMHRFEGIVVYFGFLILVFVAGERMLRDDEPRKPRSWWRRWLLPLGSYYAATLGIPIANGLYAGGLARPEFVEHAIFVLVIPIVIVGVLAAARSVRGLRPDLHIRHIN
ncbi:MAG: exosortase K [Pyrinomonadaceae bacterium]